MNSVNIENPVEREAMLYLEDQAYAAMLNYKEPVRSAEISAEIGNELYSSKLLRHVLAASRRFAQIDRRWDLEIRYEDKQRPMERILNGVVAEYGKPMTVEQAANEISSVFDRSGSYYESIVSRLFSEEDKYFALSGGLYGIRTWIVDTDFDSDDDVIYYNEIDEAVVKAISKVAAVDWAAEDPAVALGSFIKAMKSSVDNKAFLFFRWKALGASYDSAAEFNALYGNPDFVWLSDGKWADKELAKSYDALLSGMAEQLAEDIMEEAPAAVVERAEEEEDVAPTLSLNISERDLDEVAQIVSAKGEARMPAILENIFEISPRDPIYAVAAEGLSDAMRLDSRFTWVGTERWRMAETIPDYVKQIPADFEIPVLHFESSDGEVLDVELEDDGLEGGLEIEIHNPLVQDVNDCDPITEQDELPVEDTVRCTVSRHHLKHGTFPLCRIPKTFFPAGPHLIQVTLIAEDKKSDVWVNKDTGIIYDMDKWYTDEMPESGALFLLEKTAKPDEFNFVYKNDTDPLAFISSSRMEELIELAGEAEKHNLSMFEILLRILQQHRKGLPFVTLFTEVNIVRRTNRRLVASILSSYYAFYQKPKSAVWNFDEKKEDQGFKKAKRKYVRKG